MLLNQSNGLSEGIFALWRLRETNVNLFNNHTQQVVMVISEVNKASWIILGMYTSTDYKQRQA